MPREAEPRPPSKTTALVRLAANSFLVHGTEVVRAVFGPTSRQYKQFIEHNSADHAELDSAASAGEPAAAAAAAG